MQTYTHACMYMYVCMYIYIYIYIHTYVYIHIFLEGGASFSQSAAPCCTAPRPTKHQGEARTFARSQLSVLLVRNLSQICQACVFCLANEFYAHS